MSADESGNVSIVNDGGEPCETSNTEIGLFKIIILYILKIII